MADTYGTPLPRQTPLRYLPGLLVLAVSFGAVIFTLARPPHNASIVGTWATQYGGTLVFDVDGSYTYYLPGSDFPQESGTYTAVDGILTYLIQVMGQDKPRSSPYTATQNELNVTSNLPYFGNLAGKMTRKAATSRP